MYPWTIYLVEPTTVKHFCLTVFLYTKVPSSFENGTRRIYLSRKAAKLVYALQITKSHGFDKHDKRYNPTRIISATFDNYKISSVPTCVGL